MWNLFAIGEQILRVADCKILAENPEGFFRLAEKSASETDALFVFITQAREMPVMWVLTPSYQYRKPSTLTTSPTFRVPTVV